jgi:hypothetical protein
MQPYCAPLHILLCAFVQTQSCFAADAPFWREHKYHNPATGYFSYLHSLSSKKPATALEQIIRHIHALVCKSRPEAKDARFAEVRCTNAKLF